MFRCVQVVARVRPMNSREVGEGDTACVKMDGNGSTLDVASDGMGASAQSFTFDRVFGFDSSQEEVYDMVGKPVVEGLFEGYNGTVFAYGQVCGGCHRELVALMGDVAGVGRPVTAAVISELMLVMLLLTCWPL